MVLRMSSLATSWPSVICWLMTSHPPTPSSAAAAMTWSVSNPATCRMRMRKCAPRAVT